MEVLVEVPHKQVEGITKGIPKVIIEDPKEKFGELEKTLELRVKIKKKFRTIEGSDIAQYSSRKKRNTQ